MVVLKSRGDQHHAGYGNGVFRPNGSFRSCPSTTQNQASIFRASSLADGAQACGSQTCRPCLTSRAIRGERTGADAGSTFVHYCGRPRRDSVLLTPVRSRHRTVSHRASEESEFSAGGWRVNLCLCRKRDVYASVDAGGDVPGSLWRRPWILDAPGLHLWSRRSVRARSTRARKAGKR